MDRHYYFFEGVHGVVIARTRHEWKVQSVVRKTRDLVRRRRLGWRS